MKKAPNAHFKIGNFKNIFKPLRPLSFLTLIGLYAANIALAAGQDQCEQEDSQWGIALLNYTYRSIYPGNYPTCYEICLDDEKCMSLNFWWTTLLCELNNRTKYMAFPKSILCDKTSTYMEMMREPQPKKILYRSCRDVHPSCGDGEYPIDPKLTEDPFTVYCDMTTDGGDWTLIYRTVLESSEPPERRVAETYRNLSKYKANNQQVLAPDLLQLRQDMGYTQLRFYCYKKTVGTVVHIMTNNDNSGEAVVKYFTNNAYKAARPQACGSYTVCPDDNSSISQDCELWGWSAMKQPDGKYGVVNRVVDHRLYFTPMVNLIVGAYHVVNMHLKKSKHSLACDDNNVEVDSQPLSAGDTWLVYVR